MKPKRHSKWLSWEGMTWPLPETDENSVEWKLRYGEPTKGELLFAASVLNAYRALVLTTDKQRKEVVKTLKEELNKPKGT